MTKQIILVINTIFFSFTLSAQWNQIGLDIDGEAAEDFSGYSVSMSADGLTLATGAPYNDGNGFDAGHVRIYKLISSVWTQQGGDIDGEAAGDQSGKSVSISADGLTVAIGAQSNSEIGTYAGHVRIYKFISGVWTQQGGDIDGEAAGDRSGKVSMSDDGMTVAIGARANSGNGTGAGHVRVYKFTAGTWVQQGLDIDGETADDVSGASVSVSSDGLTVAIGAIDNGGNGAYAGHVRVYKFTAGTWVQQGSDIDGEAINDVSGSSVSLNADGLIVAIGAVGNGGNGASAGHVRVYKLISGVWTQQGADIDGEAVYDFSGYSVSLSSDGLIVAIGATRNSENGTYSGQVRVYKFISGIWTQQGVDIDGDAAGDQTGTSVSMSADGLTVAIGASGDYASELGRVRVYKMTYLGTDENNFGSSFTVYPNPTSGQLSITLGEVYNNINLKVTDVKGQLIDEVLYLSTKRIDYNIKGNVGVYFIEITSKNQEKTTIKVIKN